ncbi:MAG: ParB/RepB/Spo0J family partition protein [Acidobacteria bacterium]|nr:ParB/RepB/Spo0J family partition protein [Acidobacteriota bacterium]
MTRKALGRGLGALLGEERRPEDGLSEIDIDRIRPNPYQPRTHFQDEALAELAQSLKSAGVLQPIVVRRAGDVFELIAGERRWRAAALAGLSRIPALIKDLPAEKVLEASLIENIQREDLNPMEEARAFHNLQHDLGLTQEEVAERVGKERSSVTNYLRLLRLPVDVQQFVEQGKLSMGHARAVLSIPHSTDQSRFASEIIARGLSVRSAERLSAQWAGGSASSKQSTSPVAADPPDPNLRAAQERLRRRFSTIVRILPGSKGGRIEIDYQDQNDLTRIFELLIGKV